MNRRKFNKATALLVLFMFAFSSIAMAAVPSNTIIVGENAVDIDWFLADPDAALAPLQEDIEALEPVYVYTEGADIYDVFSGTVVTQEFIDQQAKHLYDAQGNKTVLVEGEDGDKVVEVSTIVPINVPVGTGFKDLGLPETATVTYSDGTTADVAVTGWGGDKYEKDVAGVYNLVAELNLPDGVTYAAGVGAPTVKVTVGEEGEEPVEPGVLEISSIDPNTGDPKTELVGNGINKVRLQVKLGKEIGVVEFSSTLPTLSQDIVTLQKGEADVDFTPLVVSATTDVKVRVTVIEADKKDLIGTQKEMTIKVLPISGDTQIITKKVITAVNAEIADRITLYANTADFEVKDLVAGDFTVLNRLAPAEPIAILGFVEHPNNPQAVIAILNRTSGEFPMTDNAQHELQIDSAWAGRPINAPAPIFENTKSGEIKFDLVDANHPKVLEVKSIDQLTIEVRYSEPVADYKKGTTKTGGDYDFAADYESKYILDGRRISNIPGAVATVGNAVKAANNDLVTKDERHIVTIKFPVAYAMSGGNHVLQVENIGDWASVTDTRNVLKTQTINFNVETDDSLPEARLVQHSPEQIMVIFNKILKAQPEFMIKNAQAVKKSGEKQITLEEGLLAKNFTVTNVTKDLKFFDEEGKEAYLIELNQDWTLHYDTLNDNVNYWSSSVNPQILYINDFEDLLGNEVASQEIPYAIARDSAGPQILEINDKTGFGYMVDSLADQVWQLKTNEPVQIQNLNLTLPNTTPSQTQSVAGLDDVEIEFSKGDKQVEGNIIWVAVHDFLFDIQPLKALDEAGEWDLEIKGLTDDVGNSQDTLKFTVTIKEKGTSVSAPMIDWVDAHIEDPTGVTDIYGGYTHIHVKFNNNMMVGGSSYSVERTENWNLDGYDLPEGSSIVKGIPFLASKATNAITIKVPSDWVERNLGERLVLDYSALKDETGATLASGRVILTEDGRGNGDYEYARKGFAVENHAIYENSTGLEVAKNAPVTSPITLSAKDTGYYMTGHGYSFGAGAGDVNVGTGTYMNVNLEDMTIAGDLAIDINKGSIELDNVTVLGTTTIISAGSSSVVLKSSNLGNIVVKGEDVRVLMLSSTATGVNVDPGKDKTVTFDSDTSSNLGTLTLTSGTLQMRSQNGNKLSAKQIARRLTALAEVDGKVTGAEGVDNKAVREALGQADPEPGEVEVTGVTLNETAVTLKVGDKETLVATVAPADADNKAVNWASSDDAVATVDNNGEVTAVAAGTATITVTTDDGGKTATCVVTVEAAEETKATGIADVLVGALSFKDVNVKSVSGVTGAAMFKLEKSTKVNDFGTAIRVLAPEDTIEISIFASDGSTVLATGTLDISGTADDITFNLTATGNQPPPAEAKEATVAVLVGALSFKDVNVKSVSGVTGAAMFKLEKSTKVNDFGTAIRVLAPEDTIEVTIFAADGTTELAKGTIDISKTTDTDLIVELQ